MEAFRYRIVTEWSDEDGAFIARVPALEGCAAHGATPETAAKEAREAALGILESMGAHRDTPPPEDASVDYSGQLRLRLPKSLHERISLLASAEELSINSLLVSMISEAVGQRKAHARTSTRRQADAAATQTARAKRKPKVSAGNPAR
jgi:predicted RNase H-like HicB family nuclease